MENDNFIPYQKLTKSERAQRKIKFNSIMDQISQNLLQIKDDDLLSLIIRWERAGNNSFNEIHHGQIGWDECVAELLGFKWSGNWNNERDDIEWLPPTIDRLREILKRSGVPREFLDYAYQVMPDNIKRQHKPTPNFALGEPYDYRYIEAVNHYIESLITPTDNQYQPD